MNYICAVYCTVCTVVCQVDRDSGSLTKTPSVLKGIKSPLCLQLVPSRAQPAAVVPRNAAPVALLPTSRAPAPVAAPAPPPVDEQDVKKEKQLLDDVALCKKGIQTKVGI